MTDKICSLARELNAGNQSLDKMSEASIFFLILRLEYFSILYKEFEL